jgi:hypothetical protein
MLTSYSKSPYCKTRAATKKKKTLQAVSGTETAVPNVRVPKKKKKPTADVTDVVLPVVNTNLLGHEGEGEEQTQYVPDTQEPNHDGGADNFENVPVFGSFSRPTFLNEPCKNMDIHLSDDSIELLSGDKWLSNEILDFLIKQATPVWLPSEVVIPSSNVEHLLDELNGKCSSTDPLDMEFVKNKRNEPTINND